MISDELQLKINDARNNNKTIGLVQGSWDLFHIGHLRYLKKARNLCDFLIIGMDSDVKIKKRKGNSRPIIPEEERYGFIELLGIADGIVIKQIEEEKWGLIKKLKPDVLIAIKDNYSDADVDKLKKFCKEVAILPRQSTSSTSDKIRKITISNQKNKIDKLDELIAERIEEFKKEINFNESMPEPIPKLVDYLKDSTDWVCPVAAASYANGEWHLGSNHVDFSIPKKDIESRSELLYATVEHAEINLIKKLGDVPSIEEIWTTLFPCDSCMKVLIDKGIKKIYYFQDHENNNWSKKSHERAKKAGIELINIIKDGVIKSGK